MEGRILSPNEFLVRMNLIMEKIRYPRKTKFLWSPNDKPLINKVHAVAIVILLAQRTSLEIKQNDLLFSLPFGNKIIELSGFDIEYVFKDANENTWNNLLGKMGATNDAYNLIKDHIKAEFYKSLGKDGSDVTAIKAILNMT